ncbi:MAG: hypothetical protein ABIP94_22790 [Planctomycetota bacterium]
MLQRPRGRSRLATRSAGTGLRTRSSSARVLSDAAIGFVGGFFSGFASDLNVVTGNSSSATRNLTKPFKTNARKRAN